MTIVIVDDDLLIRNWLSILLRQTATKDLRIFETMDVQSALEICENQTVDLVISDIRMPRQSGLELIKILRERYPDIRTAVLSSYSDFDYVRLALQYGAIDYIVKPEMKLEDIVSLLNSVKVDENPETINVDDYAKTTLYDLSCQLDALLNQTTTDTTSFINTLTQIIPEGSMCVSIFTIKQSSLGNNVVLQISDICQQVFNMENFTGTILYISNEVFVAFYNFNTNILEDQVFLHKKLLLIWSQKIKSQLGLDVKYNAGSICQTPDGVVDVVRHLTTVMALRNYYVDLPENDVPIVKDHLKLAEMIAQLQEYIKRRQFTVTIDELKNRLAKIHLLRIQPSDAKAAAIAGMTTLFVNTIFPAGKNMLAYKLQKYIVCVTQAETSEDTTSAVNAFLEEYEILMTDDKRKISPHVEKIVAYIDSNYMNKITLELLESVIHLNKTYICHCFKKEYGLSFKKYLDEVRLSHAKQLLLESHMPVYSISESVGFASQNYFTKVFKGKVGISPLKYRKLANTSNLHKQE